MTSPRVRYGRRLLLWTVLWVVLIGLTYFDPENFVVDSGGRAAMSAVRVVMAGIWAMGAALGALSLASNGRR